MSGHTGLLVIPLLLVFARPAFAQRHTGPGMVLVPNSSIDHPGEAGVRTHTAWSLRTLRGILAAPGWDVCTGVGSPNGKDGK